MSDRHWRRLGADDPAAVAADRAFRDERAVVLATLIRHVGDFQLAEDALQDAFESALAAWRRDGIPDSPRAWLTTAARRRAIDRLRRNRSVAGRAERLAELVRLDAQKHASVSEESAIGDDRLRLIFTCCHPALDSRARVALTLRALGGLTTGEIARNDARRSARVDGDGRYVTLGEQDRALWNRNRIREGLEMLDRAVRLGRPGQYQLQAAITALHIQGSDAQATDWAQIAELYGALARLSPTPVVELNRAAAVGFAAGPKAGLELLEPLLGDPSLERYQPLHATRADLLRRAGDLGGAARAYEQAIALSTNAVERAELERGLRRLNTEYLTISAGKISTGTLVFDTHEARKSQAAGD